MKRRNCKRSTAIVINRLDKIKWYKTCANLPQSAIYCWHGLKILLTNNILGLNKAFSLPDKPFLFQIKRKKWKMNARGVVIEHTAGRSEHRSSVCCYHGLIHHLHLFCVCCHSKPFFHQPKHMQNRDPFHFYRELQPSLWQCLLEDTFDTLSYVQRLHETMAVFNILISRNAALSSHKDSSHISHKHHRFNLLTPSAQKYCNISSAFQNKFREESFTFFLFKLYTLMCLHIS